MISYTTGLNEQTITDQGIERLLAGGPLDGYMPIFRNEAQRLGIDANLVVAWYLYNHRRESVGMPGEYEWFQSSPRGRNNPFDFTCTALNFATCALSTSQYARAWPGSCVYDQAAGFCWVIYNRVEDCIAAAFWLVDVIRREGARTYGEVLRMMCCNKYSSCGYTLQGCDDIWVQAIIAQAYSNAWLAPRAEPCDVACCVEMTDCKPCDPNYHCFQPCDKSCCKQSSTCLACADAPDCPIPPSTVIPPPKDTNKPGPQPGPLVPTNPVVPSSAIPWLVVGGLALAFAAIRLLPSQERPA